MNSTKQKFYFIAFCLCGFLSPSVYAIDYVPPDIKHNYADKDPAALSSGPRQGDKAAWRRHLNEVIQRNPKDIVALTSRGYLRTLAADFEGANEDYLRAFALADPKTPNYRHILWSLGWSHFNLGDDLAALDFWRQAEVQHGGSPYWVPYTVALSYWRLGKKDIALAYYDLAVKNNADWGAKGGVHKMTHHWKPLEKKLHAELFSEYLSINAN
jgi:tetratricopeptide (TPR) repeat protein